MKALFNHSNIYIAPQPEGAPWWCRLGCEHDKSRLLPLRPQAGTQPIRPTCRPFATLLQTLLQTFPQGSRKIVYQGNVWNCGHPTFNDVIDQQSRDFSPGAASVSDDRSLDELLFTMCIISACRRIVCDCAIILWAMNCDELAWITNCVVDWELGIMIYIIIGNEEFYSEWLFAVLN